MALVNRDPVIGFTIRKSGNRSAQTATITIENQDGDFWTDAFPARAPISIIVEGTEEFNGYVDHLAVTDGVPGQVTVECAGRTMRLKDAEVRPIVYDEDLDASERDGGGVPVQVSGGQIQLPNDPRHVPIDDLISVTVDGLYVLALNMDKANGIVFVDQKYNGSQAIVSYTCFKERYDQEPASDIATDLMERHGQGFTFSALSAIATPLTFEPSRKGNLLTELGRIRDYLGNTYDFFLDNQDDLNFFQRDATPVAIINGRDVRSASFSVDYSSYANKVTVRSSDAITNVLDPTAGDTGAAFIDVIEGLNPTGSQVDMVSQGFVAQDSRLLDFSVKAARATEEDVIDWSVRYNGRREAIYETHAASHSLTPDSTNIVFVPATDHIHVKANGVGTAYYSSDWREDLNQDTSTTTTTVTTTSNIYQTITVADLARKLIKGIAFKTATTANNVTFKIYSGSDGSAGPGALLGTSEAVLLGANDHEQETDWFAVYFADPVDVSAETTISIVPNMDAGTMAWGRSTTTAYAGGTAKNVGVDLTSDFTFQFFTVQTLQDILAGVTLFKDSVTNSGRVPLYYMSRNYDIGNPDAATWAPVFNNIPILFTDNTPGAKLGFKISFNSSSLTTDPLFYYAKSSVAYAAADVALDQDSGIIVGGLYGTAESDVLPYYNPTTGTFTNPIETDETRLEPNGNYWLNLVDGNQVSSASHFTVFYNDGSSAAYTEDWDDSTAVASSTSLDVSDGEAGITRNAKSASFVTSNLFTTANVITAALYVGTNNLRGGRVFPMVSRNHRNYYNPERSTVITKAAANTGELCILQFDIQDVVNSIGTTVKKVVDQSGNGFDAMVHWQQPNATGKYGAGLTLNKSHQSRLGIGGIAQWIMGDVSFAFWLKPTAALVTDERIFTIRDTTREGFTLAVTAAGQLRITHTYNDGASTETHDTDNTASATVLVNGTFTHVAVRRTGSTSYDVYFDGVLKNTFAIANAPDFVATHAGRGSTANSELVLCRASADAATMNGTLDELRIWNRVVEDWVINHVKDYAYRDTNAKFTFPAEADGTDDYTTADAADGVLKNLRVAQFFWPTFNYEDGILLRAPFNFSNSLHASAVVSTATDLSSYAHVATATGSLTTTADLVSGGGTGTRLDLDGSTEAISWGNDDAMHINSSGTLMWYQAQDVTGTKQTIIHKRNEVKVETTATSASLTSLKVTLYCQGGVVRAQEFVGLAAGTAQTHLALTYDGQVLQVFVAGTLAGSADFGSPLAVAKSVFALYLGGENNSGSTVTNWFDGKVDEFMLLNYVATSVQILALDNDLSAGLRGPTQQSYVVSAYDGTSVSIYPEGKFLVSRDNGETWVDTLDGTNSNPYGTLAFRMTFGKDNVQAIRRDQDEIDRSGIEVGKVFEVPSAHVESLRTAADGYLAMIADGISKGTVVLDGRTDFDVGEIVTVNYPEKGQDFVDYAIASVELVVSDGSFSTTLQLGEEERAIAGLFGAVEVGIQ
jgi:Concanavalin A-like lectin/glucanases superfamily